MKKTCPICEKEFTVKSHSQICGDREVKTMNETVKSGVIKRIEKDKATTCAKLLVVILEADSAGHEAHVRRLFDEAYEEFNRINSR